MLHTAVDDRVRPIPGKDNGIDCEGLAVAGDRVFIGLRGPVLRGWAMIIELQVGGGPGLSRSRSVPGIVATASTSSAWMVWACGIYAATDTTCWS